MPMATAAVLSANHEPFVLEEVEVESPRATRCWYGSRPRACATPTSAPAAASSPSRCRACSGTRAPASSRRSARGPDLEAGDRVVMTFAFCGDCRTCRSGQAVYCESWAGLNLIGGSRADGTPTMHRKGDDAARALLRPVLVRHPRPRAGAQRDQVPERRALEMLGPLGCGIQTGAQAVLNVLRPEPGLHSPSRRGRRRAERAARRGNLTGATGRRRRHQPRAARAGDPARRGDVVNAREAGCGRGADGGQGRSRHGPDARGDGGPRRAAAGHRRRWHRSAHAASSALPPRHGGRVQRPRRDRQGQQHRRDEPGRRRPGSRSPRSSSCTAGRLPFTSSSACTRSRRSSRRSRTPPSGKVVKPVLRMPRRAEARRRRRSARSPSAGWRSLPSCSAPRAPRSIATWTAGPPAWMTSTRCRCRCASC